MKNLNILILMIINLFITVNLVYCDSNSPVSMSISYCYMPGTYYYRERIKSFTNGIQTPGTFEAQGQNQVNSNIQILMIGLGVTKNITKKMDVGFETGFTLPYFNIKNIWQWNAETGIVNGIIARPESSIYNDNSANKIVTNSIETEIIPFMMKLDYILKEVDKYRLSSSIKFGKYIVNQTIEKKEEFYCSNNDYIYFKRVENISRTPSVFGIDFVNEYRIRSNICRINFGIDYIMPYNSIDIDTSNSWNLDVNGTKGLRTIKMGYEFGGISYNIGLGINF